MQSANLMVMMVLITITMMMERASLEEEFWKVIFFHIWFGTRRTDIADNLRIADDADDDDDSVDWTIFLLDSIAKAKIGVKNGEKMLLEGGGGGRRLMAKVMIFFFLAFWE